MKKVLLILAFVFTSISFTNARQVVDNPLQEAPIDCISIAIAWGNYIESLGYTYEQAYIAANIKYEDCLTW